MLKGAFLSASLLGVMTATSAAAANYPTGYSATWFNQISLTDAVETQASGGAGFKIGLVDTGVAPSNAEIYGRVTSSTCAAVTFNCSNGGYDDNGHGTATASIAAGSTVNGGWMAGVAPRASIIAEKVLNASGSGYDTDVANGIIKAANAGAQVINLSLTYTPTNAIVSAINYAATKGAVVVYAGGNSSAALNGGLNTTGLTAAALSRLIFVGSVNSKNTLSSFSNTPGSGSAVLGATKTSYASLWLVAPGENIVAPGLSYGSNAYAYWTGTSMAAPMVSGSVALLETTWPVLARNGTTAALLFQTATDLGAAGVDQTYGEGLLNLAKAFQPVGVLSVLTLKGQSIPVSQVSGATLTSGALGALSGIQSTLSAYTAFDTFQRNFTVNLSGLIGKSSSASISASSLIAPPVTTTTTKLMGGASLSLTSSTQSFADSEVSGGQALQLAERTLGPRDPQVFAMSFTSAKGSTFAFGKGLSSLSAFAEAMWGPAAEASASPDARASNALMDLAQGGYFTAFGTDVGDRARLALSWSASPAFEPWSGVPNQPFSQSSSNAVGFGLTVKANSRWRLGLTISALNENNGLLGALYNADSLIGLGARHQSRSIGLSSLYDLGGGRFLLIDASLARVNGGAVRNGLISAVSSLDARALGIAFVQSDAFKQGDHFTLSVRKPLRVMDGSAQIAVTTVDSDGYPVTGSTRISLRPNGDETDFGLGYATPLKAGSSLSGSLDYRADAQNVRGQNDVSARLAFSQKF